MAAAVSPDPAYPVPPGQRRTCGIIRDMEQPTPPEGTPTAQPPATPGAGAHPDAARTLQALVADIAKERPPGGIPPGTERLGGIAEAFPAAADAPGPQRTEEAPTSKLAGGVGVVHVSLELESPAEGEKTHDMLRSMIRCDDEAFGPPVEDVSQLGGGYTLTTLRRRPSARGTLFKRELISLLGDGEIMVTTSYEIDGEGDDLEEMARRHSLGMVYAYWAYAERAIDPRSLWGVSAEFVGRAGGKVFVEVLRAQSLGVPILVLSDLDLYPDEFYDRIAERLAGRIFVAELDTEAAAELTDAVGKGWSCFSGSARVYHPGWSEDDDPDRHAIWRRRKILPEGEDEEFAADSFQNEVVREVFLRPREWDRARIEELTKRVDETEERAIEAAQARDARAGELAEAKETLAEARLEIDILKEDKDRLEQERRTLRTQFDEFRERRTVQGAVDWARCMFVNELVVGEKVDAGVSELNPDAGPPDRVFYYLVQLSEFAREMRRAGEVGDTVVGWFYDRGCKVSRESKRTQEEFPRDFPVNGTVHRFDWHMKPNNRAGAEGVRIHFKWDADSGKVLVGWVGPHQRTVSFGTQ